MKRRSAQTRVFKFRLVGNPIYKRDAAIFTLLNELN